MRRWRFQVALGAPLSAFPLCELTQIGRAFGTGARASARLFSLLASSLHGLSPKSALRAKPVVGDLSLECLVNCFNIFLLALSEAASGSGANFGWSQNAFGLHHPMNKRVRYRNEKFRFVAISLHIRPNSLDHSDYSFNWAGTTPGQV
jgi:hypothetical protein